MNDTRRLLIEPYRFNTLMLSLGLGDLNNEDANHRLRQGEGSSIAFVTGHLLATRYQVLNLLGASEENPWQELFGGNAPSRDGKDYPSITTLKAAWNELGETFLATLESVDEARLLAPLPEDSPFPVSDRTVRGAVGFLNWHESYHMGQVGILRTELGHPSMQAITEAHLAQQAQQTAAA